MLCPFRAWSLLGFFSRGVAPGFIMNAPLGRIQLAAPLKNSPQRGITSQPGATPQVHDSITVKALKGRNNFFKNSSHLTNIVKRKPKIVMNQIDSDNFSKIDVQRFCPDGQYCDILNGMPVQVIDNSVDGQCFNLFVNFIECFDSL